jgi:RNA polymerase sigma factor (sigma-70 family)
VTDDQERTAADAHALEAHRAVLLAAARSIVLVESEAQDLVQATLEIALRQRHALRDPAAVRSWLLTIEAREAFRILRRLRRLVSLETVVLEIPASLMSGDDIDIRSALARLPLRIRAAVVLHHMAGLSVAETAAALGTSPNTVKTQLRDGLTRLRRELRDE